MYEDNIYFYEYIKKIIYMIQIHYGIRPIKNKSILNLCESLKMKNINLYISGQKIVVTMWIYTLTMKMNLKI